MITEDGKYMQCDGSEDEICPEQIPNHSWGRIKAEGWFQTKDNRIYCPAHQQWLAAWRKKKAQNKI